MLAASGAPGALPGGVVLHVREGFDADAARAYRRATAGGGQRFRYGQPQNLEDLFGGGGGGLTTGCARVAARDPEGQNQAEREAKCSGHRGGLLWVEGRSGLRMGEQVRL